MKPLPWFRLYTEIIDDEKLGLLAFEDRWHFVALLCLKGKGVLDSDPDMEMLWRKVAFKMGLTGQELEKVVVRLARMNLIDRQTLQPLSWDVRQMQSDTDPTAAERKRKQRERARRSGAGSDAIKDEVTDVSRVTVTNVTRTDTDTDTDIKVSKDTLSPDESDDSVLPRAKADQLPNCPHGEVLDLFAKHLPELPQPKPELWEGRRADNLRARWKFVLTKTNSKTGKRYATNRDEALAWFGRFFAYVATCPHLMGHNGRGWQADMAWLVNAANFSKVLQGNYDGKEGA